MNKKNIIKPLFYIISLCLFQLKHPEISLANINKENLQQKTSQTQTIQKLETTNISDKKLQFVFEGKDYSSRYKNSHFILKGGKQEQNLNVENAENKKIEEKIINKNETIKSNKTDKTKNSGVIIENNIQTTNTPLKNKELRSNIATIDNVSLKENNDNNSKSLNDTKTFTTLTSQNNVVDKNLKAEVKKSSTNIKEFENISGLNEKNRIEREKQLALKKAIQQELIEKEKRRQVFLNKYLKNRLYLKEQLNQKIKEGVIDIACKNFSVSEDFMKRESEIYKNFYPSIELGNFKLTQYKNLEHTKSANVFYVLPLKEVLQKAKENNVDYKQDKLEKNLFVIEVNNKTLFNSILQQENLFFFNLLKREKFYKNNSHNLQEKNLNDLTFYTVNLNEKDKNDLNQLILKAIEYNSVVCVY